MKPQDCCCWKTPGCHEYDFRLRRSPELYLCSPYSGRNHASSRPEQCWPPPAWELHPWRQRSGSVRDRQIALQTHPDLRVAHLETARRLGAGHCLHMLEVPLLAGIPQFLGSCEGLGCGGPGSSTGRNGSAPAVVRVAEAESCWHQGWHHRQRDRSVQAAHRSSSRSHRRDHHRHRSHLSLARQNRHRARLDRESPRGHPHKPNQGGFARASGVLSAYSRAGEQTARLSGGISEVR